MAARAGVEPMTLRTKGVDFTYAPHTPRIYIYIYIYIYIFRERGIDRVTDIQTETERQIERLENARALMCSYTYMHPGTVAYSQALHCVQHSD